MGRIHTGKHAAPRLVNEGPRPEIVYDFFGRSWLVAFAGEEVAAGLKRPLEVQRVIALRRRLAEIYEARMQQLDPGLNVDPARPDTRDIRKRFVVPNVDPANPFFVPSLEPEDWPAEARGQDDDAWKFDEYSDPRKPAHFGRTPSEPSETPSIAFDDWLMQGERALLLSGAPRQPTRPCFRRLTASTDSQRRGASAISRAFF